MLVSDVKYLSFADLMALANAAGAEDESLPAAIEEDPYEVAAASQLMLQQSGKATTESHKSSTKAVAGTSNPAHFGNKDSRDCLYSACEREYTKKRSQCKRKAMERKKITWGSSLGKNREAGDMDCGSNVAPVNLDEEAETLPNRAHPDGFGGRDKLFAKKYVRRRRGEQEGATGNKNFKSCIKIWYSCL
ncbi:unnamed protein product [Microthlaspi erraticum]|uniref:Uncharacterized protein n=1 Tax=Microthlaspi erraticum TaxID=1685480 RepID=A0A6D2JR66_9BRAS|nr:unnamed protein product [Microthlaspi erraticum]